ncbi:hypothetical protein [Hydrogenophaga sp.]|jgi:hypothetical protein|uniref:hypothetical protein n=1 Tax=Hydrogenophaga sp. TaxID=1904254 RepID=UPI003F6E4CC3
MTPHFADTIVQVSLTGSLVRIDLGTVTVVNKDGKQEARLVPTQQLVMPLDGFVRGFGVQQQAVNKLIADGVLKPHDPQAKAETPAAETLAAAAH